MTRDITEDQRAWLGGELEAWRALGLVTEDQARAVLALYGTEREAADRRRSQALSILMFLAALLSGLGALLLVAYNWQAMPAAVKVALILAGVAGCHGLGFWLRNQPGKASAAQVAFFLGCLIYGAGIALIGQIFHLRANDASVFWWWALGVLPFALALESLPFHVLYVGLVAAWAGTEVLGFRDLGAWLFGRWGMVPNGAYGLLALAAPGFLWAYRRNEPRALALYVPLVAWWVILQPFAWRLHGNPAYFIGAVGGLLLLAAELHRRGGPMAVPYRFYGAVLVAGVLVPMSFIDFHRAGWREGPETVAGLVAPAVVVGLTAVMLAVAVAMKRRSAGTAGPLAADYAEVVARVWLPVGLVLLFAGVGVWEALVGDPIAPTIAANIAMLAVAFWLARVGLREDRGRPFAVGVGYFLFWTMLRYFDLFGDFGGMLGAALMFFLCGASLFGVAMYWRTRKGASLA